MKKQGIFFTKLAIVSFGIGAFFLNSAVPSRSSLEKRAEMKGGEEKEEAQGAAEWIRRMRANPLTGTIDLADVMAMRNQVDARTNAQARMASGTTLQWKERGPDNVGGRTRAFLFDKNNPNHVFAGSVGGGLWVSNNAGQSWYVVDDHLQNLSIGCITQSANGDIYIGTGEMFNFNFADLNSGVTGWGIYKSTDGGVTFNFLTSTKPNYLGSGAFSVIGELAASPTDNNRIYAATSGGIRVTSDGGATWFNPISGSAGSVICRDIQVAPSDGFVYAYVGNNLYTSPTGDNGSFTKMTGFPTAGGIGRAEFAVSPTNSSYVYCGAANSANSLYGIFQSTDKGVTWTQIGFASTSFQPYSSGPANPQGGYNNSIAVDPANPGRIFIAGLDIYSWSATDGWRVLTNWADYVFAPDYVHADIHVIKFHPTDPNLCFVTCDGGVFRSINMGSTQPTFKEMNKFYRTTQFYSVAYSSDDKVMLGGTQDNGSWLVDGTGNTALSGRKVAGGDGGYAEMSMINTKAFFIGSPGDGAGGQVEVFRSSNMGSSASRFFDSHNDTATGGFVTPFRLWESFNDVNSLDSIDFVADPVSVDIASGNGTVTKYAVPINSPQAAAEIVPGTITIKSGSLVVTDDGAGHLVGDVSSSGTNTIDYTQGAASVDFTFSSPPASGVPVLLTFNPHYTAGSKITLNSANNHFVFTGVLPVDLDVHETYPFQDPIQAGFAISLSNGVWFTKAALRFESNAKWFLLDPTITSNDVLSFEFSPDGNVLFIGTYTGSVYRISNLSSIKSKQDTSSVGTKFNLKLSGQVQVKQIASGLGGCVTSLSVNPYNGNNVVATIGNYGVKTHIYRCIDALSSAPTFTAIQGSGSTALPDSMPVYSSVIDISNPDRIIVGTELGIWMSEDKGVTWSEQNQGMARVATFKLRQQYQPPWMVANTGIIYAGTHGRAMFSCDNFRVPLSAKDNPVQTKNTSNAGIIVYPNPAVDKSNISFNLDKKKDVTLSVYTIQGKLMTSSVLKNLKAGTNHVDIDCTQFSAGTYLVSITGEGVKASSKIAVTR